MTKRKNKVIAIITSAVVTASIAATVCVTCSALTSPKATKTPTASTSYSTKVDDYSCGMANPFKECKNLKEAEKISGIKLAAPEYSQYQVYAYKGMIEIQIANGDYHKITIRKTPDANDNTGLYGDYQIKKINIGSCEVTLKMQDGKIYAAYFTAEDGTISITSDSALKLSHVKTILKQYIDAGTKAK